MFHSNLRNLREMSGYSQKEFADLVGIPVTTYRNYENTLREPSYDILIKIANILRVSVGELIGAESGDEKYAAELLCANPAYSGKSVFSGGEILEIPVVEGTDETEGGYLPAAAPWKE